MVDGASFIRYWFHSCGLHPYYIITFQRPCLLLSSHWPLGFNHSTWIAFATGKFMSFGILEHLSPLERKSVKEIWSNLYLQVLPHLLPLTLLPHHIQGHTPNTCCDPNHHCDLAESKSLRKSSQGKINCGDHTGQQTGGRGRNHSRV